MTAPFGSDDRRVIDAALRAVLSSRTRGAMSFAFRTLPHAESCVSNPRRVAYGDAPAVLGDVALET